MIEPRYRLLFVLPDLKGGGAPRVTLALLGALDPRRYDISLLNLGRRGEALESQLPNGVRLLQKPRWLPGLIGARLTTLWQGRSQDLLIACVEMRATFCVHFAARWLRKPVLAWVHIAFEGWARGFGARHHRRSRAAYAAIPHLIFVSEQARVSMREWLGYEGPQWRSIPNLFRAEAYQAETLVAGHNALLERLRQGPSVIGIGRLESRKGFDHLLAACAQAMQRGINFDLVILGEGRLRQDLLAQAAKLGIGERLFLPGYVANPLPWLQAARLYVLSSRLEGLPTTILEAFAAGTPVIATDCPSGPREMLANDAGVLVPVNDETAMARAIEQLLENETRRADLIMAGRAALLRYSPHAVVPLWNTAISQALGDVRG